ncbi:MAG TPA: tRNA-(ms[2]io[6]A)-hydroxylase [Chitinophagaceae bacterium]|nr:tRNA-(ms[2]io[6]A)-hydroxylase [Chitinophagaceae bacterium]
MSSSENTILGLKLPTDPRWVNLAEISLEDILTDHAYCEQKAASHCISLIQKYPQYEKLVEELSPIVTEEWGHFRMVLSEIRKRNLRLGTQRKDLYVNALNELISKGGHPIKRFMDQLLVFALIEARSCERFRLLSEELEDPYLREFYRKFMISEAGHYRLFLDLAKTYCPEDEVTRRWKELLEAEKEILRAMDVRGDRMH